MIEEKTDGKMKNRKAIASVNLTQVILKELQSPIVQRIHGYLAAYKWEKIKVLHGICKQDLYPAITFNDERLKAYSEEEAQLLANQLNNLRTLC